MKNTLLINQYVRKFLLEDKKVSSKVFDRVFPLDALQGTSLPFIVITRQSTSFDSSKDGYYEEIVPVQVTIVGKSYNEAVELANDVRGALEHIDYNTKYDDNHREGDDEIIITDSKLTGCYESLYNSAYIQQLDFEFEIQ